MVNSIDTGTENEANSRNGPNDHLKKIFVGGLPGQATEKSLQDYFNQFGLVTDAVVMRDVATNRSRGFGFVTFASEATVNKVQGARPHKLDGKLVDTKRAQPRGENTRTVDFETGVIKEKKIFIGGLKECHTEDVLYQYFSQFGNVANVKILIDKNTGRSRGFGFLEFTDADAVQKATSINRHTINYTLVDVKKCVDKQDQMKKPNGANIMHLPHNDYLNPDIGDAGYATYSPMPQMPVNLINNWDNYYRTNGQQNFAAPPDVVYSGAYAGVGAGWPTNSYTTQPYQSGWPQNNYTTTQTAISADSGQQSFGEYKQIYNGGPQKANFLQNKRVNPYGNNTVSPKYGGKYSYRVRIPSTNYQYSGKTHTSSDCAHWVH